MALLGEKGKWYDHKVSVKDPVKTGDVEETTDDTDKKEDSSDKETAEKADASKDEKLPTTRNLREKSWKI